MHVSFCYSCSACIYAIYICILFIIDEFIEKKFSFSIQLHVADNCHSLGIFRYLPYAIIKFRALIFTLPKAFLCLNAEEIRYTIAAGVLYTGWA